MSPVATETPTPGWGLGPTPAYTVIYTGKLHHDRGRYLQRGIGGKDRIGGVGTGSTGTGNDIGGPVAGLFGSQHS